jgi:hypothetical protein
MTDEPVRMCIDPLVPEAVQSDAVAEALDARVDNLRIEPLGTAPAVLEMAVDVHSLWPTGARLNVRFMDGIPEVQRKVEERAREWTDHANVAFDFVKEGPAEIRISFDREGSWSYLGIVARQIALDEPTMNYGWLTPESSDDEVSRVVLHEFGHALGAFHEHQNPDVSIPWDKPAVYAYYARSGWSTEQVDRNVLEAYRAEKIRHSRFDRESIMLYAVDNALTVGDWEVGWNRVLSSGDKAFIASQYPRTAKPVPSLEPGGRPVRGSIGVHGEVDSYQLTIERPGRYVLWTEGPTDVTMSLFGPDDEGVIRAFDDDSGRKRNAKIISRLQPGRYVARVQHFRPTGTGDYGIAVRTA